MASSTVSSGKRKSFYTDLDHLKECFDKVDTEESGFIGCNELAQLVASMPNSGDSIVSELMEKLDRDRDGKVSFDDFVWLFELERDSTENKGRPEMVAVESIPAETTNTVTSCSTPISKAGDSFQEVYAGEVILRRKPRRMTMPARIQNSRGLPPLSPILAEQIPTGRHPLTSDPADLASQMKYLTESTDSPQLKRNSKVLSWIESGDMLFEDTGTGVKAAKELPSPTLSPTHVIDEASHVVSILEFVCNSKDVSEVAITKLCEHVKADHQEEQELITLLHHLDSEKKGYVSVVEFAQGLQNIKNSVAAVGSSTPARHVPGFTEMTPPKLNKPLNFSTPSNEGSKPPLSSTPMVAPSSDRQAGFLAAIDPNQSGFVKVDDIINYWQKLGIDCPHDQKLDELLAETIPVDANGQVSIEKFTEILEGSMTVDGELQNVLRQFALSTFKKEISDLRNQVHQISMERDKLKGNLNRTTEEKQRIITEGDEHVDMIAKKSEKEKREQEMKCHERVKEVERIQQQEAIHLQEKASNVIKDLEARMKELKGEEEKQREDLRYAQDELNKVTQQFMLAQKELQKKDRMITMLQKDLGSRSDHDIADDETQSQRLNELESEVSEKNGLLIELQEKLRAIQDNYDELKAENERMKQKNIAQKRAMQKSYSVPNTSRSNAMGSKNRTKLNRPLSGSHFHRRSMPLNPHIPISMDLDLAVQQKNHPILLEEQEGEEEVDYVLPLLPDEKEETLAEQVVDPSYSQSDDSTDSSEDEFGKSTTSLMEEFRQERLATLERKRSSDLEAQMQNEKRKNAEIVAELKKEIFRLEEFAENQQEHALTLEEEKSQIADELKELRYEIESERRSHEVEVNILSRKIDNAENCAKKLESSLEQLNMDYMQCKQDCEMKISNAEKKAELEKSSLNSELQYLSSDRSALQSELVQMKQQSKIQKQYMIQKSSEAMSKLESKYSQQTNALKLKHDTAMQKLNMEIDALRQREESLQRRLDCCTKELEEHTGQLHTRESAFQQQISVYEASEIQYQNEISHLSDKVSRLQGEVLQMMTAATMYRDQISSLKEKLQEDSELEISWATPLNSRSLSSSPESSTEIITKMKVQLGELQKVLESKSSLGAEERNEVASDINKILASTASLEAEVQRMRQKISLERLSHQELCSQKDCALQILRTEKNKESKLIKTLAQRVSKDVSSDLTALQSHFTRSFTQYEVKLDELAIKLANIHRYTKERDNKNARELDKILSELDQSHKEVLSFKHEIQRLQAELEKSHHRMDQLTESQHFLEELNQAKDAEVHDLKSQLDQFIRRDSRADQHSTDKLSSHTIKVDADSGQVISEQDESLVRGEHEEVLRGEIKQLQQALTHSQLKIEDMNQRIIEKDGENNQVINSLCERVSELETKLEQETCKHKEEILSLERAIQLARDETEKILKLQHSQKLQEIEAKYNFELGSIREELERSTSEARDLYSYVVATNTGSASVPAHTANISHSEIMSEVKAEIHKLREEFIKQQAMYDDMEATLADKIEEHEVFEAQFTTEHEEEVRALRQQKQCLVKELKDLKDHYESIFDNQEQENATMLEELMIGKSDLDKQLTEKTEETFLIYQQMADISEEKKVLLNIIKQLCVESGQHIIAL